MTYYQAPNNGTNVYNVYFKGAFNTESQDTSETIEVLLGSFMRRMVLETRIRNPSNIFSGIKPFS